MVKIGVIGGGTIAELHLNAYSHCDQAELVGMCDIDEPRAKRRAAEYGIPNIYTSAEDLLANPDIDAVSVCTRNDSHAEIAIAALDAGKSVLVEKPMTTSVEKAERIVEAEKRSKGIVQVGYVRRFSPNAQVLQSFVEAGSLGDVYLATGNYLRMAGNPGGWFADRAISGGGPLIDLGVHIIDLLWYFMGRPKFEAASAAVFEKLGNRSNIRHLTRYMSADYDPEKNAVEDLATAFLRFEGGAAMQFGTSYSLHGKDELSGRVYGTKGGASIAPAVQITTEMHDTIVDITPRTDSLEFELEPAFQNEINHFVRAAAGETASGAPATDGLEMLKIIEAIYRSGKEGREVRVS